MCSTFKTPNQNDIINFKQPLNDCPATEYFIEITGPTHTKVVPVLSTFNTFNVSLMASRVYSVRLTASRAEDYVSTGYTSVCKDASLIVLHCIYICTMYTLTK